MSSCGRAVAAAAAIFFIASAGISGSGALAAASGDSTGKSAPAGGSPGTDASIQRGRDLLDMAVAAAGNAALYALKDFTCEESGVVTVQGADHPVRVTTIRLLPDCERTEQKVEKGSFIQVICGDKGWIQTPDGIQDMTAAQIMGQKAGRERELLNVLRSAPALKVRALSDTASVGGKRADLLAVQSDLVKGWKIYLDHTSHRIVRMEYQEGAQPSGRPSVRQETYSSYVPVNGLYWPQMRVIQVDGAPAAVLRVVSASSNTGVSSVLFQKAAPAGK